MFGHRKGAFTGADRDKPGLLEIANGGTLLARRADGDVAAAAGQAPARHPGRRGAPRREREGGRDRRRPLHLGHQSRSAGCVAKGTLREDLLYRLRVVPIAPPAPAQAAGGHPAAGESFPHDTTGTAIAVRASRAPKLSEARVEFLRTRPWRGNVRELQNVIEQSPCWPTRASGDQPDDVPIYEDAPSRGPARSGISTTACCGEPFHVAKDEAHRAVRAGVSHPARRARRWEHVQGRAAGEHRPDHPVSADGEARLPP